MAAAPVEVPYADRLDVPEARQWVRGQEWVVTAVKYSHQSVDKLTAALLPGRTLVSLASVSDDDLGEELTIVGEVESARKIVPASRLPEVSASACDDPQTLGAFLDGFRWDTVLSRGALRWDPVIGRMVAG